MPTGHRGAAKEQCDVAYYQECGGDTPVPTLRALQRSRYWFQMPGLDGFGMLREFRGGERTRAQPFLVMTSSKEVRDSVWGYHNGCDSNLPKPPEPDEFADADPQSGRYRRPLNEGPPR